MRPLRTVPAVAAPPPAGEMDPAERLKQLKSLHNQGLIDGEVYQKKLKEIMDSL